MTPVLNFSGISSSNLSLSDTINTSYLDYKMRVPTPKRLTEAQKHLKPW